MLFSFSLCHVTYYRHDFSQTRENRDLDDAKERRARVLRVPPRASLQLNSWSENHLRLGTEPPARMRLTRNSSVQHSPNLPEFFSDRSQEDWLLGAKRTNFGARLIPTGLAFAFGAVLGAMAAVSACFAIAGITMLSPLSLPAWLVLGATVGGIVCAAVEHHPLMKAHRMFIDILSVCEIYTSAHNQPQQQSKHKFSRQQKAVDILLSPYLQSEYWVVQQAAMDCAILLDVPCQMPGRMASPPNSGFFAQAAVGDDDICDMRPCP